MKRTTFTHHKLIDLAGALDISEAEAIGVLGFLWHSTGEYAECGNIGRFTNTKIAELCRWRGDAVALIDALVATGWLDQDNEHRLVVHDWAEHCEDSVHARVARKRAFFVNGSAPMVRAMRSDERTSAEAWYAERTKNGKRKRTKTPKKPKKTPSICPVDAPVVRPQNVPGTDCGAFALPLPLPCLEIKDSGGVSEKADEPTALADPPGFAAFWRAWPKHVRKDDRRGCFKIWKRERLEDQAETVLKSLPRWKRSEAWTKDGGQFIPAPAVWLNKQRWLVEDIPEAVDPGGMTLNIVKRTPEEIRQMFRDAGVA